MNPATEPSLAAQRQELRARLQAQRQVIAQQLSSGSSPARAFPRSLTMQLLTKRPQMIIRILGALVGLLRLR